MILKKQKTKLELAENTATVESKETMVKTVVLQDPLFPFSSDDQEECCYFELIKGPDSLMGHYWKMDKEKISIGRSRFCYICIPDPSVSKQHLTVRFSGVNKISIIDKQSTNGTYVNNIAVSSDKEMVIQDNDLITFGNVTLKFLASHNPEIPSVKDNFKRSFTDSLTGVGNRLMLDAKAPDMFFMSQKKDKPLSVIIFDIDFFKKVNDQYGHLAGDYVLKEVARLARSCFRTQDLFVRSGGEEFCVFLHSSKEVAKSSVQRMREKIQDNVFQYDSRTILVTISAGVSACVAQDSHWKDAYKRADEALYQAKKTGRNKVCTTTQLEKFQLKK